MSEDERQETAVDTAKAAGVEVKLHEDIQAKDIMAWFHDTKNPPDELKDHHSIFAGVWARRHLCRVTVKSNPLSEAALLEATYPPEVVQAVMEVTEPIIEVVFPPRQ